MTDEEPEQCEVFEEVIATDDNAVYLNEYESDANAAHSNEYESAAVEEVVSLEITHANIGDHSNENSDLISVNDDAGKLEKISLQVFKTSFEGSQLRDPFEGSESTKKV